MEITQVKKFAQKQITCDHGARGLRLRPEGWVGIEYIFCKAQLAHVVIVMAL